MCSHQELLEVKQLQIRAGRVNEAVMVKRMADRLLPERLNFVGTIWTIFICCSPRFVGLRGYQGDFTFIGMEQHLYRELHKVQGRQVKGRRESC